MQIAVIEYGEVTPLGSDHIDALVKNGYYCRIFEHGSVIKISWLDKEETATSTSMLIEFVKQALYEEAQCKVTLIELAYTTGPGRCNST